MLSNPHTIRANRLPLPCMGLAQQCLAQCPRDSGALPHERACPLAGVATVGDGRHPALTMRRNKTGLHAQPCTGGGDDVGGGACVGRQLPHGLLSHGSPLRPVLVRDRQLSGLRSVPGYARRASVAAVKRFARRPRRHGRIFGWGGGKTLQTNKIINQPKNTGRWTHEN